LDDGFICAVLVVNDGLLLICGAVGWSDPAHVEFPPRAMVNNAMASAQAAFEEAFATTI
jgi:hypothetical protein